MGDYGDADVELAQDGRQLKQHNWASNMFLLEDVILAILLIYFICESSAGLSLIIRPPTFEPY